MTLPPDVIDALFTLGGAVLGWLAKLVHSKQRT